MTNNDTLKAAFEQHDRLKFQLAQARLELNSEIQKWMQTNKTYGIHPDQLRKQICQK